MRKKKKPGRNKRGGGKEAQAHNFVRDWLFSGRISNPPPSSGALDGFGVDIRHGRAVDKVVFELHCHSNRSDGILSPAKLVERANANGVNVLALTDHDTMAGVAEAVTTARRFRMKIIPGVEISTRFSPRRGEGSPLEEEMVHILAYYGSCGPHSFDRLEKSLSEIREGRHARAEAMVSKLNRLNLPLEWDSVTRIAGGGVAPGRLHVALAMVEAGHVVDIRQAFDRFLHDGGPAYSKGSEPPAEEALRLVAETGGVSVLAHPWSLKDPFTVIRNLQQCGLDGLEVYRRDGLQKDFGEMADALGLMKIGGSDYHGSRGSMEADVGSVRLSMSIIHRFLVAAGPKWGKATCEIIKSLVDESSERKVRPAMEFLFGGDEEGCSSGFSSSWRRKALVDMYTSCSSEAEQESDTIQVKLSALEF